MPELPDITVYLEAIDARVSGHALAAVRLNNPFVLRTARPPIETLHGRRVMSLRRLGKRIALGFEGDHWLVLHLMVAGRLHWKPPRAKLGGRLTLAALEFGTGALHLTEAGTTKRASLHVVASSAELAPHDPGGINVPEVPVTVFAALLRAHRHTLKRALTNPRLCSGIGNAYSDEILHAARLSPVMLTSALDDTEMARLHGAIVATLSTWTDRLRAEAGGGFPEHVTAFRPEMAVHGKFGRACPVCGLTVQRIRYADNETNYCPGCQTGGKMLADRSLSRLLKSDWPRTAEGWEQSPANRTFKT